MEEPPPGAVGAAAAWDVKVSSFPSFFNLFSPSVFSAISSVVFFLQNDSYYRPFSLSGDVQRARFASTAFVPLLFSPPPPPHPAVPFLCCPPFSYITTPLSLTNLLPHPLIATVLTSLSPAPASPPHHITSPPPHHTSH